MTAINTASTTEEPWYKQFWPWFIILLPSSVVVAGIVTVFIAVKNADSLVHDDYYQQGMGINRQLALDENANVLAAYIVATLDVETGQLRMALEGKFSEKPLFLEAKWIHPTSKDRDFSMQLKLSPTGDYVGQLTYLVSGRWYLQVSAERPIQWQLKTELSLDSETDGLLHSFNVGERAQ